MSSTKFADLKFKNRTTIKVDKPIKKLLIKKSLNYCKISKLNPTSILRTPPYSSVTIEDINIGTVAALTDTDGFYGVVGIDITIKNLTEYLNRIKTFYTVNYYFHNRELFVWHMFTLRLTIVECKVDIWVTCVQQLSNE